MAGFPHAQIPDQFQDDERTSAFMEDMRKLAAAIKIFGNRVSIVAGSGSPEGVVTERGGSLYLRQDGPPWFYVKETADLSSLGWTAK